MALGAVRTRGKGKALPAFVRWCLDVFVRSLEPESAKEVRQIIKEWDITVRVLPRRIKLWEQYATHDDSTRTRGVTVLPAPTHPKYRKRRISITLGPELLPHPDKLAYVLMHEMGHALRYAEFQRIGWERGWPDGAMLRHEENEADAEQTAQMFVWGVMKIAQRGHVRDPRDIVRAKFHDLLADDAELQAAVVRAAEEYGGMR